MFEGPRTALASLTRLPGGRHPTDKLALTKSVPWFPVVGILVGGLGAAVYLLASMLLSPVAAALLAVSATALATGAFHEDGLADSFDALAGGWDKEQRLRILQDSRLGTFGVLSLVLVTLLKVSGLAAMTDWDAAAALVAAHSLGRSGAVMLMVVAPTATESGLAADYTRSLSWSSATAGSLIGVAMAALAFGVWGLVVVGLVSVAVGAVGWWGVVKIGGVNGDLLGAAEQVGEVVVLLCASALVLHA